MEEVALGAIISRITTALAAGRANIKQWSDEIADLELLARENQDSLNILWSEAFVSAATETNKMTGKLVNPNIDSQKAATMQKLPEKYIEHQNDLWQYQLSIQKKKNAIVCEHERRGDLKTEVELLKLLNGSDA